MRFCISNIVPGMPKCVSFNPHSIHVSLRLSFRVHFSSTCRCLTFDINHVFLHPTVQPHARLDKSHRCSAQLTHLASPPPLSMSAHQHRQPTDFLRPNRPTAPTAPKHTTTPPMLHPSSNPNPKTCATTEKMTPLVAFERLFFAVFGQTTSDDINPQPQLRPDWTEGLFKLIFGTYLLVSVVVLINLLIAMMSDTYQRIQVTTRTVGPTITDHRPPVVFSVCFVCNFSSHESNSVIRIAVFCCVRSNDNRSNTGR